MKSKVFEKFAGNTIKNFGMEEQFDKAFEDLRPIDIKNLVGSTLSFVSSYLYNIAKTENEREAIVKITMEETGKRGIGQLIELIKKLEELIEILEKKNAHSSFLMATGKIIMILSLLIEECDLIDEKDLTNNFEDVKENLNIPKNDDKGFSFEIKKVSMNYEKQTTNFLFTKFLNRNTEVLISVNNKTNTIKMSVEHNNYKEFNKIIEDTNFIKLILAKAAIQMSKSRDEEVKAEKTKKEISKTFLKPLRFTLLKDEKMPKF